MRALSSLDKNMGHRPEIDGLRALAVLFVIFFHAGFDAFSGGFVGVDVFFVISGYLISNIIITELGAGKFSLVQFYERRLRRISPALLMMMLFSIPVAWVLLLPSDLKNFSNSLVAVTAFVSNVFFWRESGYFDSTSELKPLLHTWSLGVEGQYYLVFPLLIILLRRFSPKWSWISLILAFLISLAAAQWCVFAKPGAAFYLLPMRAWELLIGGFAAFCQNEKFSGTFCKSLRELGGLCGVILIVYCVFTYNRSTPFPGLSALVPTIGSAMVIIFSTQQTILGKIIGWSPISGLGLISYSAYLWHWPIFVFAKYRSRIDLDVYPLSLLVILTFIIAYYSWRLVEVPFRKKAKISRRSLCIFIGMGSVFMVSIGLLASNNVFGSLTAFRSDPYKGFQRKGLLFPEQFKLQHGGNVFLWGDSYADSLAYPLANRLGERGVGLIGYVKHSCPSLLGVVRNEPKRLGVAFSKDCREFNDFAIAAIESQSRNEMGGRFLVITSAYAWYDDSKNADGESILKPDIGYEESGDIVLDGLLRTIRWAKKHNITPVVVMSHPVFKDFDRLVRNDDYLNFKGDIRHSVSLNKRIAGVLDLPGVFLVDPNEIFCGKGATKCPGTVDNSGKLYLWRDGSHLTNYGAELIAERIADIVAEQ